MNRKMWAASLGNVMEWYDFCLYGYFAPLIAKNFFPNDNPYLSLMLVFLTFGGGYLMRPLGALLFGRLADLVGAGRALYYSICCIVIPTFLIGLLPSYHQGGKLASSCLLLLRLIQGLSAGGQYTGALTFICKNSIPTQSAQRASTIHIGSLVGFFLASIVGMVATKHLSEQLSWRVPFLLTILLLPCLHYSKKGLLIDAKPGPQLERASILLLLQKHRSTLLKTTLLGCIGAMYYSSFFIFLLSYLKVRLGMDFSDVFLINCICLVSSGLAALCFSRWADRFGRKPLMLWSSVALVLLIYPVFDRLFVADSFWSCLLGVWLLTTANTGYLSACAVVYVELFPKPLQYTGCSVCYNIGSGTFGGFSPFLLTMLLHRFGVFTMSSALAIGAGLAVLVIYFLIPETLEPGVATRYRFDDDQESSKSSIKLRSCSERLG